MKATRKRYSDVDRQRLISAIKVRLKDHNLASAIRLVSNLHQTPTKSLEKFWYARKKLEAAAPAEEPESHDGESGRLETVVDEAAGTSEKMDRFVDVVPVEPPRPYLCMDFGEPKCSRCGSKNVSEVEEGRWLCGVCGAALPFEDPGDMEIKYHRGHHHHGPYGWMV